jgi:ATP phosphoribosyltransferase
VRPLLEALVCVDNADVAQLVEHNLAKVGVAGSNPVVRSHEIAGQAPFPEGASSRQDPSIARLSRRPVGQSSLVVLTPARGNGGLRAVVGLAVGVVNGQWLRSAEQAPA